MSFKKEYTKAMLILVIYIFTLFNRSAIAQTSNADDKTSTIKAISVNGTTLHYIEQGKGIPVVFVHGSVSDYRTWNGQIKAFAVNHRVIAYSRRYHNPNDWPVDSSDFSIIRHVKDLVALIQKLNLGKVHLVGHSWGAYIALITARDHPELIRSLTLGEPPVMGLLDGDPEGEKTRNEFFGATIMPAVPFLQKGDYEKGVSTFINGVMGRNDYFEIVPPFIRTIMLDNARSLTGDLSGPTNFSPFTAEDAGRMKVPVLVMEGADSPQLFNLIDGLLTKFIPNSSIVTIPKATHGLEFDNPAAFNKAVLDFIGRH